MMTPKQKAVELIDKFTYWNTSEAEREGIKSALSCIDEMLESNKQLIHHYTKGNDERYSSIYLSMSLSNQYFQEVKQEIENLYL